MNDREVLSGRLRDDNPRDSFRGRRKRREKREREMANSISKLRTMCPVPGMDGVERFELGDAGAFHDAHQIQASVGDSSSTICEADQRERRARRPDFGVSRPSRFKRGERKNNVADRARPNEQPTTGDKIACPTSTIG
jgi:hypothetical protein